MPYSDFFSQLGLFVLQDFFDAEFCATLCEEMRQARGAPGRVGKLGLSEDVVDETIKRRTELLLPPETISQIEARLLALKPELENHFRVALKGCQTPKPVRYSVGDYYHAHLDTNSAPEAPQYAKERQVAIVIFLNDEEMDSDEAEEGSYCGGSLTFYGLVDDPQWKAYGLPLIGERGLLVAFRPDILHEVKPVTRGERYTITSWFF